MRSRLALLVAVGSLMVTGAGAGAAHASSAASGGRLARVESVQIFRNTLWIRARSSEAPILRSANAGRSWTDVTPAVATRGTHFLVGFGAVNVRDAWVTWTSVGSESPVRLLLTSNGGRTWHRSGPALSPYCEVQFDNPRQGWCVERGGAAGSMGVVVRYTGDGGQHWRLLSRGGPDGGTPGALPFGCDKSVQLSGHTGWAPFFCAGGPPQLFRTTDRGRRWTAAVVPPAVPPRPGPDDGGGFVDFPQVRGSVGVVEYEQDLDRHGRYHRDFVLYRTSDGGASWTKFRPPGRDRLWRVAVVTAHRWWLQSGSTLLITDDAGMSWHRVRINRDLGAGPRVPANPPTLDIVSTRGAWLVAKASLWRTRDGGSVWDRIPVIKPGRS